MAKRLAAHGLKETKASLANKLTQISRTTHAADAPIVIPAKGGTRG